MRHSPTTYTQRRIRKFLLTAAVMLLSQVAAANWYLCLLRHERADVVRIGSPLISLALRSILHNKRIGRANRCRSKCLFQPLYLKTFKAMRQVTKSGFTCLW